MSLLDDAYTISAPRVGDARIRKLVLTGWCANYISTEQGRLYWRVNTSDELELFKDESYAVAELVCSGAVNADDTVTLNENNSSGISGNALVTHTDGTLATGEVILTYASELDLLQYNKCATDFLDTNGQFNGEDRFENLLKRAKTHVDKQLIGKLSPFFRRKGTLEVDLSAIAKPRQLSEVHALYALHLLYLTENSGDLELDSYAKKYEDKSGKLLGLTQIEFDHENDDVINDQRSASGSRMTR